MSERTGISWTDHSFHHTKETIAKLSVMRSGSRNPFFGRKHTPEAKAKMAAWTRNKNAMRQYDLQPITLKPLPRELWAYIAGLIDGEGSIAIKRDQVQICVYNCNCAVMEWLKNNLGGQYRVAHRGGRTPNYCWNIGGARNIHHALNQMAPFIIIKKQAAAVVHEFLIKKYGERLDG